MLKIVMSKIEYSDFSKLIKLSDSIKSFPHSFCAHHATIHGEDKIIHVRPLTVQPFDGSVENSWG